MWPLRRTTLACWPRAASMRSRYCRSLSSWRSFWIASPAPRVVASTTRSNGPWIRSRACGFRFSRSSPVFGLIWGLSASTALAETAATNLDRPLSIQVLLLLVVLLAPFLLLALVLLLVAGVRKAWRRSRAGSEDTQPPLPAAPAERQETDTETSSAGELPRAFKVAGSIQASVLKFG